jgi:hypothetical protein
MEAQIVDFAFSNFRTLASNVNILSLWNAVSQSVQRKEKQSPTYLWIVFYLSETEEKNNITGMKALSKA